MTDGQQVEDTVSNNVVKNIQALIDTHLPAMPRVANDEGQNPTTSGTKNRVENLPALREEIELTEKLEVYFRELVMRLLFEEREEEKLKPRKYSRELKLPLDTITRIISFIYSNNPFTGVSGSCLRAQIIGIPFIAIFYTSLLQKHFDKEYDPSWTLANIAKQEIKWSILEEKEAIRYMHFDVTIKSFAPKSGRGQAMLYSLLRFSKHWRTLKVYLDSTMFPSTTLRLLMSCIPYLDHLKASAYDNEYLPTSCLEPNSKLSVNAIGESSLKILTIRCNLLQTFFDLGICKTVTELTLIGFHNCFIHHRDLKPVFTNFVRGLSDMPCLRELRLDSLPKRLPVDLPPIESQSLRHVTINCFSFSENDPSVAVPFLKLFAECPIDSIGLWDTPKPVLEVTAELFPGLKQLIYHMGRECEILFTPRPNGGLVFPCLERLTFGECNFGDEDKLRNQIIEIASVRTRSSGIIPLKMITVHKRFASASFIKELEGYVPFVERCYVQLQFVSSN